MKNNDFGFIITAYKQLDLVEENINRIRNRYKYLNNSVIIVVSTSEEKMGFKELEKKYENVFVIEYLNAPLQKGFILPKQGKWFLPARILFSIRLGLLKAKKLKLGKVLHIHSDVCWDENKENNLLKIIDELNNYYVIADGCIDERRINIVKKEYPDDLVHLHPEGLFFNIDKCDKIGYGFDFDLIFSNDINFEMHNSDSIEAILIQFFIFCLTGKNIIKREQIVPKMIFDHIKINVMRTYHGDFEHGLINLKIKQ